MNESGAQVKAKSSARRGPTTVAKAYFAALSDHDLDAMEALWEPGCTDVLVGMAELRVPAEFRAWFGTLFEAMPDLTFEVVSVTAQKEHAALRWVGRGTFNGSARFEGLEPNGSTVEIHGCDVLTVRDGKIVENYGYLNGADLARQLGALPPAGSAAERGMTGALNAKVAAAKLLERVRDR